MSNQRCDYSILDSLPGGLPRDTRGEDSVVDRITNRVWWEFLRFGGRAWGVYLLPMSLAHSFMGSLCLFLAVIYFTAFGPCTMSLAVTLSNVEFDIQDVVRYISC